MDSIAIATVVAVTGTAYARNADGELREIRPGDVLLEGETIVTPDGGTVELSLSDGSPMIVDVPELTLTTDMVADLAPGPDESAVQDDTIDAVLAALESGEDLGDVLAATAAGPGGSGPAGAGHSFIRLGRIVEGTDEFTGVVGTLAADSDLTIDQNLVTVDAIDDSAQTDAGESVTIAVEGNDIFLEGEDVISITQPENGTAVLNDDDTVTYTPDEGFSGEDKFEYTAVGPDGTQRDTATVTVDVAPPPPVVPPVVPPVISIGDDVVVEGGVATVTVSLDKASDEVVTVKFATADDTATVSGGDYNPNDGTITFQPGQTSAVVTITTNEDNLREGSEFLDVNLSGPTNATIGDGQGQVEIIDIYEEPTITIGDQTVTEGETAVVTVTLSRAVEEAVTVDFVTADGTAIEVDGDYLGNSGTLTFAPGQTTLTVTVVTLDDDLVEDTEHEFVMLSNADNAAIADPEGIVRIVDNDEEVPPPPPPPPTPPSNNPPDAVNDGFSTEVNTPVSGNVLPNDSDPDNDPLTVTGNTQPTNGTVNVNPDGSFTYTPNENFDGSDSFQYTITDGEGGSDTATVNIVVTDEPVDLLPTVRGIQSEFPEAQLPGGSAENPAALTKDGVFTVTAGDGLDTLVINGVEVIADGAVTGTNVVTDTGVQVTITSVTPGADGIYEVAYTATLLDRFQHDADSDEKLVSFTIEVTDTDGDSASAVRSASIIDDSPTAQSDANVIPAEEYGPVGGNVVTNDTLGADGAEVVGVASGDTGAALDDPGTLGTIAGLYGDLELSADGTYTYTRSEDAPGDVEDVFTYTIKDADGDLSSTTLTISIGDAPVTLDLPVEGEDGTAVDESGLPARDVGDGPEPEGSDAASPSETTAGTFFYTAPDGPAVVTIDGTAVTSAGQTFAGTAGTLTIISVNAGAIEYSYTLADNTAGDASSDSFAVSVTDQDGDNATDTLTIVIGDDVATAVDDSDSLAAGEYGPIDGNVTDNDTAGADGATVTGVAGTAATVADGFAYAIQGDYGVLQMKADGTYQYTRDEDAEGGVEDKFTYTLTDGDTDADTAVLTITIADSDVTIDAPDAEEAGTAVSEVGLAGGRVGDVDPESEGSAGAADTSETTTGSITFSGDDVPLALTIDGGQGAGAETIVAGQSYTGTYGVLMVTAINAGSIDYSYTLSDNTSGDATSDSFALKIVDSDGDEASDTLTIAITDDVATAVDDSDSLAAGEYGPIDGNVTDNDTAGADGATVTGVAGTAAAVADGFAYAIQGDYGVLQMKADGTYQYTRDEDAEGGVEDKFTYTLTDGDTDADTAVLTITIADSDVTIDAPDAEEAGTAVSEVGLAGGRVGDVDPESEGSAGAADTSETTTGSITFSGDDVPLALTIDGGQGAGAETIVAGQSYTGTYGVLMVTAINAGSIDYSYTLSDNTSGDATSDSFALKIVDSDGDEASDTLTIAITDDVATAVDDSDSLAAGEYGPIDGNVTDNDTAGADGATVTGVAGTAAAVADGFAYAIQGDYGVLQMKADGTYQYTRDEDAEGGVEDKFTYTLTDGDTDADTAVLTITIADSDVTIDAPDAEEAGTAVSEVGLAGGRVGDVDPESEGSAGAADTSETTTGSITFSGDDVPLSLTIDGGQGAGAETIVAGQSYTGTYGVLMVTAINAGSIDYSYTLSDNTSGDATSDSFALKIVDSDGDEASDTLTIAITDDVATAVDDSDSLAAGEYGPIDGNVTDNDTAGADGATVTGVAGTAAAVADGFAYAIQGDYGVLQMKADGTYQYTRDEDAEGGVEDKFTYTLTDGDTDADTAVLTITIADSDVTIDAPDAEEAGTAVSEVGLAGGRVGDVDPESEGSAGAADTSETTTGSITFSGDDVPLSLTIDGGQGAGAETIVAGQSYTGTYGVLMVTAINAGSIDYSYTLSDNTSGDATSDSFALKIVDSDGDEASDTLTIAITDDVATAVDDSDSLAAGEYGPIDGNVTDNDTAGADGATVTGVAGTAAAVADGFAYAIQGDYGVLQMKADGTYQYTRDEDAEGGVEDKFTYTLTDGDTDADTAVLTITIADSDVTIDAPDAEEAGTAVSEVGLAGGRVGDVDPESEGSAGAADTSETTTGSITFSGDDVPLALTIDGGQGAGAETIVAGQSYTGTYGVLMVTAINAGSIDYSYTLSDNTSGDATSDSFALKIVDSDGDEASDTLTIAITDDVATAVDDSDSLAAGEYGPIDGNVTDNDTAGADGATVTGVAGTAAAVADGFAYAIQGDYGVLQMKADGTYQYTRDEDAEGGVEDKFTYTLTDGDTDADTAVLTITIADSDVTIDAPDAEEAGTAVSEVGLAGGRVGDVDPESEGSAGAADTSETTTGSITFSGDDVPLALTIDGGQGAGAETIVAGQSYTGTYGVLMVTAINAGSIDYSYTLSDNTSGDATSDSFALKIVDSDGDEASDTLTIAITDDVATAVDDSDSLAAGEYGPIDGNVTDNDTAGADGATVTGVAGTAAAVADGFAYAIQGDYGVLQMKADGTYQYTRDEDAEGGVEDKFTYTLTDGDTDADTAVLTITIADSDVTIDAPDAEEAGTAVSEVGLAGGRVGDVDPESEGSAGAADTSETTTGSITFSGDDVPLSLTIDGGQGAGAETIVAGQSYTGTYGVLMVTAINAGSIDYSYTLSDNTSGDATSDSFALKIVDSDGDEASDTLTIAITDDVATAVDDSDSLAAGEYGPIDGNVTDNDTAGADGATVTGVAGTAAAVADGFAYAIQGDYGVLQMKADGTYQYTRDEDAEGGVEDKFTYTLTDGDTDADTAVLTITIADSDVTIDAPDAEEAGTAVSEVGLAGGRVGDVDPESEGSAGAADTSETTTGSITFSGDDVPLSLTIDGGQGAGAETIVAGQSYTGTYGVLMVTAINAGSIDYSYTLSDNTSGDATSDSFALKIVDSDGDEASDTLTIAITDDVATAVDDSDSLAAGEYGPIDGNVTDNDTAGADGATVTGVAGTAAAVADGFAYAIQGDYGVLQMKADGTYQYTRDEDAEGGVEDKFTYTLTDGDTDADTAVLTITIADSDVTIDAPDAEEAGTAVSEVGLAGGRVGDVDPESEGSAGAADTSETTTGSITFSGDDVPLSLTIDGGQGAGAETIVAGQSYTGTYGVLMVTAINAGSIDYSYTLSDNTSGDATSDSFALKIVDSDGDEASDTLTIAITDDVATAVDDSDSLAAGEYGPIDGNVTDNDTAGADGATVTGVAGTAATVADGFAYAIQGDYGVLQMKADGTYQYTRDEDAEGGVEDKFTYTLTDGDTDADTAVLTITIADSDVTIDAPDAEEAGTAVSEVGLAGGRVGDVDPESEGSAGAADTSETTTGSITFSGDDVPLALTIDGGQGAGAETIVAGQSYTGTYGVLMVTAINAGSIDYSYTLSDNTSGDATSDSFALKIVDSDGDEASDTLTIAITDDVATAVDDSDSLAAGEYGPIDGNVTDNDTAGADGATVTGVAGTAATVADGFAYAIQGDYGVLQMKADGTYQYTRDADTSGGVEDKFTYTLTDGDTDADTAVLTIDIADVSTTIEATDTSVHEKGLVDGTGELANLADDNDDTSETNTGSISYTGDTPIVVTIDGVAVTGSGQTFQSANQYGILTITGMVAGQISYSYTLTTDVDHSSGAVSDSFALVATDADGSTSTDTLDVVIGNDIPVLTGFADGPYSTSVGAAPILINLDDTSFVGADLPGALATLSATSGSNEPVSILVVEGVPTGFVDGVAVFTLELTDDGMAVEFTALSATTPTTLSFDASTAFSPTSEVTFGSVTISGTGLVNGSNSGLGADGNAEFDSQEFVLFEFDAAQSAVTIGINTSGDVDWTATFVDQNGNVIAGATDAGGFVVKGKSDVTIDVEPTNGVEFWGVMLTRTDDNGGSTKITSISYVEAVAPDTYNISMVLADADGDVSADSANFLVEVTAAAAPITIDLNGDGVDYLSREAGVVFTDQATGDAVSTAWVGADDGLLVVDANQSGTVDETKEYVFTEWSETAETDMQAVAQVFDTNQDGVLDANDEQFGQFAVWQDADSDGVTDEGELTSLTDLGVDSIALTYSDDSESGTAAGGDVLIHGQSTVTFTDGSTSTADDASFAQESLDLRDLLSGDEAADDLSSYLNVSFDGADTVIEVSSVGAFTGSPSDAGAVDQTFTVEGVDLVGTDELSTVIQNMLTNGQLITD